MQQKSKDKCNLSNDELIKKVQEWVSKLASTGGNAWSLRVPVDFSEDPDVLIVEVCKRLATMDEYRSQPPTGTASGGYSLEQVEKIALEAAKYGFNYRDISQHNGEVPEGNVLQWLQNFLQPETKLTPPTKTE